MISSQNKITSSPPVQQDEQQLTWKGWEFSQNREGYSIVAVNDKIVILNGYATPQNQDDRRIKDPDIVILDPKTQSLKTIPPTGDIEYQLCWASGSACYWKDNKIIVFGGLDLNKWTTQATVGIITLKDLDSENPSAEWEQVRTKTDLYRQHHFAHIYQDKMYVISGYGEGGAADKNVWCLDLATFEWKQYEFTDYNSLPYGASENKIYSIFWMEPDFCLYEYNLSSLTCKSYKYPGPLSAEAYAICSQMDDQKVYVLVCNEFSQPEPQPQNELWSFDFGLLKWRQIQVVGGCPSLKDRGYMLLCDNQLVIYGGWEDESHPELKKCWSLPIGSQKASNILTPAANLTNLQRKMKQFLKEAPYSDISFEVESQTILAHKWFLIQRSKYFANMFSSGMLEAQTSKIIIADMTARGFRAFLEFLYSNHVELNFELALELLQQADKYSVSELKTTCENYLAENITPENFVAIGQVAELVEAASLRGAVVNYTGRNIKKLKERKDFEQISDNLLRDSIVQFINN